jgi:tetratricopeptide (TPR) repeat protein
MYQTPERNQEAVELAQRATELAPDNFAFYRTLGNAYGRLWKGDEAIQVYRRAVDVNPHNPDALTALAFAIMVAKDYRLRDAEEALALTKRAIELRPDDAGARQAMSLAYCKMKMWPECLHAAREAVDLAPNHPVYNVSLAVLLANNIRDETLRNPAEAVKLASRAVAIEPTTPQNLLNLSLCQYRNDEYTAAVESYEEAQRLGSPFYAGHAFFYAMSQARLGRLAEARETYDQAIASLEQRPPHGPTTALVRDEAAALLGIASTPINNETAASGSPAPPGQGK